jgi:hypothetical protein
MSKIMKNNRTKNPNAKIPIYPKTFFIESVVAQNISYVDFFLENKINKLKTVDNNSKIEYNIIK